MRCSSNVTHPRRVSRPKAALILSPTISTVPATLTINIEDDSPTLAASATQPILTVDETNLAINATADFSGVFTPAFGADGAGTVGGYALTVVAPNGVIRTFGGVTEIVYGPEPEWVGTERIRPRTGHRRGVSRGDRSCGGLRVVRGRIVRRRTSATHIGLSRERLRGAAVRTCRLR